MKRLAAFVLLLAGIGSAYASDGDAERLRAWRAGEKVSEEAVAEYGIDRCFASSEIGDALSARMYGKSYKPDCTVPRSELRYLRVQANPCWASWSATKRSAATCSIFSGCFTTPPTPSNAWC